MGETNDRAVDLFLMRMRKAIDDGEKGDHPWAKPCVRSGMCCQKAPCWYGEEVSDTDTSCRFLEIEEETPEFTIFRCGKYNEIKEKVSISDWTIHPAFGGGCGSSLFNENRSKIIKARGYPKPP